VCYNEKRKPLRRALDRKKGVQEIKIQESAENYLEAILVLRQKQGAVRSIDVAQHMRFTKPSVSRAMSLFRQNGYITMNREGFIELTASGREIAERIYERHRLLTDWLIRLGVSPETAAKDACRIEHDLSEETFDCLKAFFTASGQ
jgi:DtxR family Mn-dependent transcriptional regulator